jgi:two-component system chemotaxis response regulator CheB
MEKTGVLVVDDSAFMRKVLSDIIGETEDLSVVDTARNGKEALEKLAQLGPSVQLITLDIQMPAMDGLECLRRIMAEHPRRVVMVSSLTTEGAVETLQALEDGAVDFFAKPGGSISLDFRQVGPRLIEVLRAALRTRLGQPRPSQPRPAAAVIQRSAQPPAGGVHPRGAVASRLVAIASSTGGPKALSQVIPLLPADLPATVVVVQHMPATFTRLLADRLSNAGGLQIKEAQDGEELLNCQGYMAPGGLHMEVSAQRTVRLSKDPPVGGLRPCADITFRSIAPVYGRRVLGVVLTGMGRDGTEGCVQFHRQGCRILAESKETALIYGMPRAVAEAQVVDRVLPLQDIAQAITEEVARL